MGRKSVIGREVPYISSHSVKWIQVSVPAGGGGVSQSNSASVAPPTEDCASCCVIDGTPPTHLIWRICKKLPHAIEILELHAGRDISRVGLRIIFPEPLSPLVSVCKDEINSANGSMYLLYVLSVSGIAYLLRLKDISAYASSSAFLSNDFLNFNTNNSLDCSPITAANATTGCLVIGRGDGSVSCFQLGVLDENAPGFMYELRDEAALSRLWGLMSRSRGAGSVKDLVISDIHGRKLLFILHSDGNLQVWDLHRRGKLFSQSVGGQGISLSRLWVGPVDNDECVIPLAILHTQNSEVNIQGLGICRLSFLPGERYNLSVHSSMQYIRLSEGKLIDVKFSAKKLWVLMEDGLLEWNLISPNFDLEEGKHYSMQEAFVAEQLFQSSEHSLDALFQTSCSIYSSSKAQIIGFVSSIFLRRLLCPGVHDSNVLRWTLRDYEKHWTDGEFQALTVDELRRKILLLIEHEVVSGSPYSAFKCWKELLNRYFDKWCKCNMPFSLLVDTCTGAVGLIRENGVSLFRLLENVELLMYGTLDESEELSILEFAPSSNDLERDILCDVLRCTRHLTQRLGPAVSPILYESVVGASITSTEDIVPRLLKTLEHGYNSSAATLDISEVGADFVLLKKLSDHRNLRKFSMESLLALHALYKKASGWTGVLNAVESYLNLLVLRKLTDKLDVEAGFGANISIVIHATSQVSHMMFESALDLLLFLSYILDISGQVHLLPDEMSRVQVELIPMIQEIITEWLIIHFLTSTPSESVSGEDFSSQLSSLKIDGNSGRRSWTDKLGSVDFTLAFILLLDAHGSPKGLSSEVFNCLLHPDSFTNLVGHLSSWIIWGRCEEMPLPVFGHSTEIALILLKHGQYDAAENLLLIVDAHLRNEKLSGSIQSSDGEWCVRHHLLGCCFLAQAQKRICGASKDKKVSEALRCFFRASSGKGATHALRKLSYDAGLTHLDIAGCVSAAAWKLQYYQCMMQKFEQYNLSDAACQFALAALEQVDEAVASNGSDSEVLVTNESSISVKGRLWANVFKFALDANQYYDAYCAIVSNPDDESKDICLRRFIIVLCERGATKILCDRHLPFTDLMDKAEKELAWKAACSDVSSRSHPYKLLYAFEMRRHNWRKAAAYIYLYSVQLKNEMTLRSYQNTSHALQERLSSISAAINCLHLVHPMHAWIDLQVIRSRLHNTSQPSKRARIVEEQCRDDSKAQRQESYVGIEKLEDEFVLVSAEHLLSLSNVKLMRAGNEIIQSELVDHLVEANLYDMAFTVVLRFWKGSGLKRELERVFSALAMRCCPTIISSPMVGSPGLLLTYPRDDFVTESPFDVESQSKQQKSSRWEVLEEYLEKYKGFHGRLPAVVAETLLRSDPHIELPLWLVDIFKGSRRENLGMSGQESDPATLLRLYVDHGRYPEATELLLECIEDYASKKPTGVIHRKKPFAAWFPYTTIERLWCHLEESIRAGYMTEQCEKLKTLLRTALHSHLILLKTDSEDAISFENQA